MQTGQEDSGMVTMNQALALLVRMGALSREDALEHSYIPDELTKILGGLPQHLRS